MTLDLRWLAIVADRKRRVAEVKALKREMYVSKMTMAAKLMETEQERDRLRHVNDMLAGSLSVQEATELVDVRATLAAVRALPAKWNAEAAEQPTDDHDDAIRACAAELDEALTPPGADVTKETERA